MIYLDIAKKIERLRIKLHDNIEKYGIDSKETKRVSLELDELINKYYKDINNNERYPNWSTLYSEYLISYEQLKNLAIDLGEFPTIKIWTEYAKKNMCLNVISMEFVSGMNWHKLEEKIIEEIKKV